MLFTTRFDRVLDTNYAPSEEERSEIRALVVDPVDELRKLDQEITRLQAQRDELNQFILKHRMLLSPFRRLPGDLWGEIFVRCLPDESLPVRSLVEAPLLFTSICHSWREIALSTPRLWNAIHISIPNPLSRYAWLLHDRTEGVKLWLTRSGSLPLTISLGSKPRSVWDQFVQSDMERVENSHKAFFTMLYQFSYRWKSLTFSGLPSSFLRRLETRRGEEDAPLVTEIIQQERFQPGSMQFQGETYPAVLSLFARSPAIRVLDIELPQISALAKFPTRSAGLTVLRLHLRNPIDCTTVLRALCILCPALLELSLIMYPSLNHFVAESTPAVVWEYLQRLYLSFPDDDDESAIRKSFDTITTPSLAHLGLFSHSLNYNQDVDLIRHGGLPFDDLIIRSKCDLLSLHLSIPLGEELAESLIHLTSLKTLKLFPLAKRGRLPRTPNPEDDEIPRDPSPLEVAITSLSSSENDLLCPNLEEIRFEFCRPGEVEQLLNFVHTRARLSTSFNALRASFGRISSKAIGSIKSASKEARGKIAGVRVEWDFTRIRSLSADRRDERDDPRDGMAIREKVEREVI
ncbi:hypothetical protein PQX77_016237 [Marasmius sp. AFHP31]|nr:hypothetical protein PQX77_016237 [Marasmius sp. AFHP31]